MPARNVVSLSVHRNTREQRQRRELRDHIRNSARKVAARSDIDGFALIAWTNQHGVLGSWDTGSIPGFAVPDFVRNGLRQKMTEATYSPDDEQDPGGA